MTESPSDKPPGAPPGPSPGGPPPAIPESLRAVLAAFSGRKAWRLLALPVVVWLFSGLYTVGSNERGVVLRFGRIDGRTAPGLHLAAPWPIDRVYRTRATEVKRIEVGFRFLGKLVLSEADARRSDMLTGDENILKLMMVAQYRIKDPGDYLFRAENPDFLVERAVESAMTAAVAFRRVDDVLTGAKSEIQIEAINEAQRLLDRYGAGIALLSGNLQIVSPPAPVVAAFDDVTTARKDAESQIENAQLYANQVVPGARARADQNDQPGEGTGRHARQPGPRRGRPLRRPSGGISPGPERDAPPTLPGVHGADPVAGSGHGRAGRLANHDSGWRGRLGRRPAVTSNHRPVHLADQAGPASRATHASRWAFGWYRRCRCPILGAQAVGEFAQPGVVPEAPDASLHAGIPRARVIPDPMDTSSITRGIRAFASLARRLHKADVKPGSRRDAICYPNPGRAATRRRRLPFPSCHRDERPPGTLWMGRCGGCQPPVDPEREPFASQCGFAGSGDRTWGTRPFPFSNARAPGIAFAIDGGAVIFWHRICNGRGPVILTARIRMAPPGREIYAFRHRPGRVDAPTVLGPKDRPL